MNAPYRSETTSSSPARVTRISQKWRQSVDSPTLALSVCTSDIYYIPPDQWERYEESFYAYLDNYNFFVSQATSQPKEEAIQRQLLEQHHFPFYKYASLHQADVKKFKESVLPNFYSVRWYHYKTSKLDALASDNNWVEKQNQTGRGYLLSMQHVVSELPPLNKCEYLLLAHLVHVASRTDIFRIPVPKLEHYKDVTSCSPALRNMLQNMSHENLDVSRQSIGQVPVFDKDTTSKQREERKTRFQEAVQRTLMRCTPLVTHEDHDDDVYDSSYFFIHDSNCAVDSDDGYLGGDAAQPDASQWMSPTDTRSPATAVLTRSAVSTEELELLQEQLSGAKAQVQILTSEVSALRSMLSKSSDTLLATSSEQHKQIETNSQMYSQLEKRMHRLESKGVYQDGLIGKSIEICAFGTVRLTGGGRGDFGVEDDILWSRPRESSVSEKTLAGDDTESSITTQGVLPSPKFSAEGMGKRVTGIQCTTTNVDCGRHSHPCRHPHDGASGQPGAVASTRSCTVVNYPSKSAVCPNPVELKTSTKSSGTHTHNTPNNGAQERKDGALPTNKTSSASGEKQGLQFGSRLILSAKKVVAGSGGRKSESRSAESQQAHNQAIPNLPASSTARRRIENTKDEGNIESERVTFPSRLVGTKVSNETLSSIDYRNRPSARSIFASSRSCSQPNVYSTARTGWDSNPGSARSLGATPVGSANIPTHGSRAMDEVETHPCQRSSSSRSLGTGGLDVQTLRERLSCPTKIQPSLLPATGARPIWDSNPLQAESRRMSSVGAGTKIPPRRSKVLSENKPHPYQRSGSSRSVVTEGLGLHASQREKASPSTKIERPVAALPDATQAPKNRVTSVEEAISHHRSMREDNMHPYHRSSSSRSVGTGVYSHAGQSSQPSEAQMFLQNQMHYRQPFWAQRHPQSPEQWGSALSNSQVSEQQLYTRRNSGK